MANNRVLYVPWPEREAGTLVLMATRFLKNAGKAPLKANKEPKTWRLFYFVPERDYLSSLQMSDQIYVLGHGLPGSSLIMGARNELTRFDLVCNRLQENGLRKHFAGKIKFYNCSGALDAEANVGPESFAGKAARLLRERGFNQCRIFGYSAPVANPDESGKKHHERKIDGVGRIWVPRASERRVEFGQNGEVIIHVVLSPVKGSPRFPSASTTTGPFVVEEEEEFLFGDDPGD